MTGIFDEVDRRILTALVRMLELDPALTKRDALARLERVAAEGGLSADRAWFGELADQVQRHAVLSPLWLAERGLHTYGFLANLRPGMTQQLARLSAQERAGVSQYSLFGSWDSLLLLNGTPDEANQLHASLQAGADDEPTQFNAQVVFSYRHTVSEPTPSRVSDFVEKANALVDDFDDASAVSIRHELLASGHILGSTWTPKGPELYPVEAFVGLSLRGRSIVRPHELLELLLRQAALRQSLVHMFQINHGVPFHYFLKLCCLDMRELDEATTAISATSRGDMRIDALTMVVASGTDDLPMFREAEVTDLPLGPDLTSIVQAGERVFSRLPVVHQVAFNQLDEYRQIAVVKTLALLGDRLESADLNATTRARLDSALSEFSRESIVNSSQPNLAGVATDVAATIEGDLKRLLGRLAFAAYGRDIARLQVELKLPTRVVSRLTLARVLQALRTAAQHPDFKGLASLFDEAWMERIERFVDTRNRWAHDAIVGDATQVIDEAHRTFMEAIELAGWIEARLALLNASSQLRNEVDAEEGAVLEVAPAPRGRDLGVFISHASKDRAIAERIAMGLRAFGVRNWYAEWELEPDDSIVTKIEAALARSDTLVVVLSAQSVTSRWVRRELNAALVNQLSGGHDIDVIPVVIEDCEIPALLRDTSYVDLRYDFEEGLLKLLARLRRRSVLDVGFAPHPISSTPRDPTEEGKNRLHRDGHGQVGTSHSDVTNEQTRRSAVGEIEVVVNVETDDELLMRSVVTHVEKLSSELGYERAIVSSSE